MVFSLSILNINKTLAFDCYDEFGDPCSPSTIKYTCDPGRKLVMVNGQGYCDLITPTYSGNYDSWIGQQPSQSTQPDNDCLGPVLYRGADGNCYYHTPERTTSEPNPGVDQEVTETVSSNSFGSRWNFGVNFNIGGGYRCWDGSIVNFSWQCNSQINYPQTSNYPCSWCTIQTRTINPAPPKTCGLGTELFNNQCVKKCTTSSGDWFYISPNQPCPTTPKESTPITCAIGTELFNNQCVKKCTTSSGDWYYISPTSQCSVAPIPPVNPCKDIPGSVNYNGRCYIQCSNGSSALFDIGCPAVPIPSKTCAEKNIDYPNEYNNQCYKVCSDGTNVAFPNSCPKTPIPITCPIGTELFNNQCVKKCTTSSGDWFYVSLGQTCPRPETTTICPSGTSLVDKTCMRQCPDGTYKTFTETCPIQQTNYVCWNNVVVQNSNQCQPQPVTYPCWNGQTYYQAGQCPAQVATFTCWNGVVVNYVSQCPAKIQYQTCWNGKRISMNQFCPTQYQTCWNGKRISINQTCPISLAVQNHAVRTDLATQVAQTSAQCNGIGLIANRISSVGWFEYGENTVLEKTTNSGNIGRDSAAPFSNSIINLKPNTQYYCRAVMANANGTYKGEIVSFKTLAKVKKSEPKITYVDNGKGGYSKKIKKSRTEFVCADGSLATAKTVSVADTINAGGKLMQLNLDKNVADLPQGGKVNYTLTVKNIADTTLTGTEIRFVLPSDLIFEKNNLENTVVQNNILIITEAGFEAGETKTYTITTKVNDEAAVGKTLIVTGYLSYYLPVVGKKLVKDEVSAYMIANVGQKVLTDNLDKKDSAENFMSLGFSLGFPQTLLSWLILLAVILIIVVLLMNIHSYIVMRRKEKEEHVIHHHIS